MKKTTSYGCPAQTFELEMDAGVGEGSEKRILNVDGEKTFATTSKKTFGTKTTTWCVTNPSFKHSTNLFFVKIIHNVIKKNLLIFLLLYQ